MGGAHGRSSAPSDRLAGQRLDSRQRRLPPLTQQPLHRPPHPGALHRTRVGGPGRRADLGHPLRRTGAPRSSRSSPRPSTGTTGCSSVRSWPARPPPRRPGRSVVSAVTPSPCCPSVATTWPTTSPTGSRSADQTTADRLPRHLLRELVPPRRQRPVPVARLRRELPGPRLDLRTVRRTSRRRRRAPSVVIRRKARSILDGIGLTDEQRKRCSASTSPSGNTRHSPSVATTPPSATVCPPPSRSSSTPSFPVGGQPLELPATERPDYLPANDLGRPLMHELISKENTRRRGTDRSDRSRRAFLGDAIVGICNEAVEQVLGPAVTERWGTTRHRLRTCRSLGVGPGSWTPLPRTRRPTRAAARPSYSCRSRPRLQDPATTPTVRRGHRLGHRTHP